MYIKFDYYKYQIIYNGCLIQQIQKTLMSGTYSLKVKLNICRLPFIKLILHLHKLNILCLLVEIYYNVEVYGGIKYHTHQKYINTK